MCAQVEPLNGRPDAAVLFSMLLCHITGAYGGAHLLEWPVSGAERKLSFELGCFRFCPEAAIGLGGLPAVNNSSNAPP
jgi:hypothetical protein